MAGDWIKMRCDLAEDPAVIAMAAALEIEDDAVVGKLHRLWSWADRQSRDGHAVGVTASWVDRYVHRDGFAAAMQSVGWLDMTGAGLHFPNFDRHNGKTAKQRALSNVRQQQHRANVTESVTPSSRTQRDKPVTREEKRREEIPPTNVVGKAPRKRSAPTPDIERPEGVAEQTWGDWLALRKAKKAPVTETVISAARREATEAGITLDAFLSIWCMRGSQGLQASWLKPVELQQARQQSATTQPNKQQALEDRNLAVARAWVPPEMRGQQPQEAN